MRFLAAIDYQSADDDCDRDLPAFADINQQSPKSLERNTDGLDWDRIAEKVGPS